MKSIWLELPRDLDDAFFKRIDKAIANQVAVGKRSMQ